MGTRFAERFRENPSQGAANSRAALGRRRSLHAGRSEWQAEAQHQRTYCGPGQKPASGLATITSELAGKSSEVTRKRAGP